MAVIRIIQFFGSLLTTAVIGFALSSNFWISFVFNDKRYHSGLWNICEKNGKCRLYDKFLPGEDDPLWLSQVRLLLVIACVASAISILTAILRLYNEKVKGYVPALFLFVTAALSAGACWLFSERKDFHNEHYFKSAQYQWGFIVGCASSTFAIIMMTFGVLSDIFTCKKTDDVDYGSVSYDV